MGMTAAELGRRMTSAELLERLALAGLDADAARTQAQRAGLADRAAANAAAMKEKVKKVNGVGT